MRRAATEQCLDALVSHSRAGGLADAPVLPGLLSDATGSGGGGGRPVARTAGNDAAAAPATRAAPQLRVLCRSMPQVEAACTVPWLQEVILDFLEVRMPTSSHDEPGVCQVTPRWVNNRTSQLLTIAFDRRESDQRLEGRLCVELTSWLM